MPKESSQKGPKKKAQNSVFGIAVNSDSSQVLDQAASSLPATVTISGIDYKTEELSNQTKQLVMIYLADQRILGQQKELLALAELGLKALVKEIEASIQANERSD